MDVFATHLPFYGIKLHLVFIRQLLKHSVAHEEAERCEDAECDADDDDSDCVRSVRLVRLICNVQLHGAANVKELVHEVRRIVEPPERELSRRLANHPRESIAVEDIVSHGRDLREMYVLAMNNIHL